MTITELRAETGPVGLGTFPLSGGFGSLDESGANEVLDTFFEHGGRYVETAPSYPQSKANLRGILGSMPRQDLFLATKCVTGTDSQGNRVRSGESSWIRQQVHSELERLGLSHIDLLQTHITPTDVDLTDLLYTLETLRGEGLVRMIGCSNVTLAQLKSFTEAGKIDFVQNRTSLIHRANLLELSAYCVAGGIALNPYQVIERGILTERAPDPGARLEGDLRNQKAEYVGEAFYVIRNWVEASLIPLAHQLGSSAEELSIGWMLAQPAVGCCVVGATQPFQVARLLDAGQAALDDDIVALIDESYNDLRSQIQRDYGVPIDAFRGLA